MAGIAFGPIASGLPKDIVERLMDAEREPVRQLQAKKQNEEARLKLAQDLVTKVSGISGGLKELARYRQFRDLKPEVGRPDLMDVSVDKNVAEPGSYQIEVKQLAGHSSMISNGLPDADETQVGVGYFSYELPNGEKKEIYIDEDHSTLNGIAGLINGQKNMDLNAVVVNDGTGSDNPYRMIVSHKKSGEVNDAEFPDFYFLDGDEEFYMDKDKPAQNSVIKVNGFDVEFEGNKITSFLPGVTIDLKDAAPGKEFTLGIGVDLKSAKSKVEGLVGKINEVLTFVQSQNKLDKDSNTRNSLGGDITLQTLEYKLRELVQTPLPIDDDTTMRLGDFGITFNRNGLLDIKSETLEKALNKNFEGVAEFFSGENHEGNGFANSVITLVDGLTRQEGVVASRVEGIKRRIRDIDDQVERKEKQLERTEQGLKDKFSRLEGTIANLKSQQAGVAGIGGGGGGAVQSLLG